MIANRITLRKRVSLHVPATLPILALLSVATLLASATTAMAATVNVHPGQWEVSTTMEVQGGRLSEKKPPVTTRCIKAEDVKDADAMVQASQKDKRCTTTVTSATSDHVAWSYECATGSGSADYAYAGDSYEATLHFTAHTAGGDHKTTQHTTARRVGDCP